MKVSQAFPSDFLKAADLDGANVRLVMAHCEMKDIGDDNKPVLHFKGKEKGLVLNKTNANNIAAEYGDDMDDWMGKEIILFTAWVDFQGKSVEAIRVRAPQPKDNPRPAASQAQRPAQSSGVRQSSAAIGRDEIPAAGEEDFR